MEKETKKLIDNMVTPEKPIIIPQPKIIKTKKGMMVNNESIIREHIQNTESYQEYMETFDITEFNQVDVDEMMRMNGQQGHYFAVKYPPLEGSYIVFQRILPPMDPVYQAIKLGVPDAKARLLEILPPYQLMIKDLPDGEAPPSDDDVKEQLGLFLKLWIDINTIDEALLQQQLIEANKNERLSEDNQGKESNNTSETQ